MAPETAEITVDGERLAWRRYTWLMMNKPAGVLSATEDGRGKTVLDLLPEELRRRELFPVGRLDKDTEGLLLLTNEGGLAHDLLSPKKHVDKVYYARTAGELEEADCRAFAAGMVLGDGLECLPAGLEILSAGAGGQRGAGDAAGGQVPSGEADARRQREAGPVPEADENGQFDAGSGAGAGRIPVFDRGRGRPPAKSPVDTEENSNVAQKKQTLFVEKRKNILQSAKSNGIIYTLTICTTPPRVILRRRTTMSGRIFQNVVLQLKENTDRTVGVIDGEGVVIACSELAMIGQRWAEHVPVINAAGGAIVASEGKTFKALNGWGAQFDYAVFAFGDNEISRTVCAMATVALNAAKSYYEEKHDRGAFIKDIISDNIMLGDIYVRAKELRVTADVPRGVFVVRPLKKGESVPTDVIQSLFPDRQNDFVLSIGEGDVVLIRQMPEGTGLKELNKIAASIEETLRSGGEPTVVVGIGTVAVHLRDLAKSYKEAQIAIEVGKVFDTEKYVINYENLGIGRLIYQLPTTLCEMFLQEVFKKNPIDALDKETLFTIHKFFENNLNVSETARKLFVHRNTLVYRLEKIKKLTGLDLREFDDAITFKVALMVKKYLTSRGIDS